MGVVAVVLGSACSPELVVGKVTVVEQKNEACVREQGEGGGPGLEEKVVTAPWSTGFESGFSDYWESDGFCYVNGQASCGTVASPVFDGKKAAAFAITANVPGSASQTRCFLQGAFPEDAVYGARFFIPERVEVVGYWNLMYFQGAEVRPDLAGLWDISLRNRPDGNLELFVLARGFPAPPPNPSIPVPIGEWFRVEFRLKRAKDDTGAIALYQDGVPLLEATGIVTDRFDFHEWYVGTWGENLMPPGSTIYVDNVTIRAGVGQ